LKYHSRFWLGLGLGALADGYHPAVVGLWQLLNGTLRRTLETHVNQARRGCCQRDRRDTKLYRVRPSRMVLSASSIRRAKRRFQTPILMQHVCGTEPGAGICGRRYLPSGLGNPRAQLAGTRRLTDARPIALCTLDYTWLLKAE